MIFQIQHSLHIYLLALQRAFILPLFFINTSSWIPHGFLRNCFGTQIVPSLCSETPFELVLMLLQRAPSCFSGFLGFVVFLFVSLFSNSFFISSIKTSLELQLTTLRSWGISLYSAAVTFGEQYFVFSDVEGTRSKDHHSHHSPFPTYLKNPIPKGMESENERVVSVMMWTDKEGENLIELDQKSNVKKKMP